MGRVHCTRAIAVAALAVAAPAPCAAHAAALRVDQLVVFRDGSSVQKRVTAAAATAHLGKRRCAVPLASPLAALIRSGVAPLKLRDFGGCSHKAGDAGGLYVAAIRGDRAHGQAGWVYKVGTKLATAGAADPSGPFGRGRLRARARVTWFYCRIATGTGSCQRTLAAVAVALGGGTVRVDVRSYDDRGHGRPAVAATVHAGGASATTGADGAATLQLPAGPTRVWAESKGAVRSFEEAVDVR